ncbi:MAG: hypothetical protein P8Z35_17880 [Ignavibacteriaceae bacterium]
MKEDSNRQNPVQDAELNLTEKEKQNIHSSNKKELKEFANFCEFRKQFLIIKADEMYKNPLNKAVSLINELKKEYNFK